MTDKLMAPGPGALRTVRPLLRALSSARQAFVLYPPDHPNRAEVVRDILQRCRDLLGHLSDPVIFVARHSLYLNNTLLARESLSLLALIESFEAAEILAIEVLPDVDEGDVKRLIEVLVEHGEPRVLEGGLLLNRIQPTLDVAQHRELELQELRRLYAGGLETLRQAAMRVAAGDPIDLDAATAMVEQLADEVVRDPAHALLLTTVKSYDEYTYYHMVNVCMLSIALGNAIGLQRDQVISLGLGGLLHDVGKVNVPAEILTHVGKLDEEQWRLIQRHPVDGAGLVFSTADGLYHPAAAVVLEHHSAYDLAGYPGLTGRPHPSLPARLVSVADCFDAVTSKRAYRAAAGRQEALGILESAAGKGFDPRMVNVFIGLLGVVPVGSLVRLDNGEVGLVVETASADRDRPVVRPVLDARGDPVVEEDRDLEATGADGEFRWNVVGTVDPTTLGFDVVEFLASGDVEAALRVDEEPPQGLVHEPSPGEPALEGYVDTHAEQHVHTLEGEIDTDVAPPFEE